MPSGDDLLKSRIDSIEDRLQGARDEAAKALASTPTDERAADYARDEVSKLVRIAETSLKELQSQPSPDDLDALLVVKNRVTFVHDEAPEVHRRMDGARELLQVLKESRPSKESKEFERTIRKLDGAESSWADAKRQLPMTKIGIAPLVKKHAAVTKDKIEEYTQQMEKWAVEQKSLPFWDYKTGADSAEDEIAAAHRAQRGTTLETQRMLHLAKTFEFPHLMERSLEIEDITESERDIAKELWQIARDTQAFIVEANKTKWSDVRADVLEEGGKGFMKAMRKAASSSTRTRGTYVGLLEQIKDFLSTCPLVGFLAHPSMRPRHWTKLMQETGKTFTPPYEDADMRLQAVLVLELHKFSAQVEEISD